MFKNDSIGAKLVWSTSIVLTLTMLTGIGWNIYSQKKQARLELLEQSRILAAQIMALRSVTAENQHKINYDSKGNFEFKHLNPAAMVQQVSRVFNAGTDYRIRQVSLAPRIKENLPDDYERQQLLQFAKNKQTKEVWAESEIKGERYFRYMVPLYINSSCLPCHGEPKGAVDISGHLKEGYKVGDLAGALTIAIPMRTKETSLNKSIAQNILLTVSAVLFSAAVIILHTKFFVTKPISGLIKFSQELGSGNLAARPDDFKTFGEINELTTRFIDMAGRLHEIYDQLEEKVAERTEELAAANRELAKISQYKSEFLANMSHELRTPLTAILAFTDLLLTKNVGQLTPEQEDYLRDIQESGQQLLKLINDLLDFSKIESGKMTLQLTEVDIAAIALDVERLLRPLAERNNLTVETVINNPGNVIADEEKVRQVIQNLLGNAIKFSPAESKITLTVTPAVPPDEGVLLIVKDSGPGIPEDDLQNIFEAFYQVSKGLRKKFKGTGLGLALVKKIVELHLGRIEVESAEGKGSTFTVYWPAYPAFDRDLE